MAVPDASGNPAAPPGRKSPEAEGRQPGYASPTLQVWHQTVGFLAEPLFREAYSLGMTASASFLERRGIPASVRHEWPIFVCCWAAWHAKHLEGDFVECGTNTGMLSMAVCKYLDFNTLDKKFYLFDTYCGIPAEQLSPEEKASGRAKLNISAYRECFEETKRSFAPWHAVQLVRGVVPDTLSTVPIDRVCYLSIDMNVAFAEHAALTYFWDKLSPGAPVVLDDYGKAAFIEQKRAMDRFATERGLKILELPTGQGLLLKV